MRTDAPTPVATSPARNGASPAQSAAGAKVAEESQVAAAAEKMTQQPAQDVNTAVRAAAQQIDSYLKSVGRQVEFRVDDDTGTTVVTVRETATGEVIRQIPNEEVLQLARRFEASSGALLDLVV
ncbi:flagellar protein FlaG [Povalibacter uvarum]|uniref:Flagellar protein FlaG n=1 Tax=Povalibacter uvarum TaxID=732238 RepID=A0A841HM82_9GAMM|nr:flagellar protein FlaG [Povalibacter uvarum]MBB6094207.1 flagellar protein FlaG [Povalibacter uvarum]